jgi:hypothetical protein
MPVAGRRFRIEIFTRAAENKLVVSNVLAQPPKGWYYCILASTGTV